MNLRHHRANELHAIDLWLIGSDDICVFNPPVREERGKKKKKKVELESCILHLSHARVIIGWVIIQCCLAKGSLKG